MAFPQLQEMGGGSHFEEGHTFVRNVQSSGGCDKAVRTHLVRSWQLCSLCLLRADKASKLTTQGYKMWELVAYMGARNLLLNL